jgi:hypothetical protein
MYAKVFLVGGLICLAGEFIEIKTKITPARILVIFLMIGAILGGFGIYNYLIETNQLESIPEFIQLPLPQPFTNIETIMNVAYADLTDYDMATTYTVVPNRAIFLLNEDNSFKVDSYERKGCLCPDTKMIDGCVYKIKTSFLKEAINAESFNNHFWNKSKICFIENTSDIFLDIDTPKELKQFELLKNVINI